MKYLNPKNYYQKISFYYNKMIYNNHLKAYDIEAIKAAEKEKFKSLGFDYDNARALLSKALKESGYSEDYNKQGGMSSVHWILFTCLKQMGSIENILEIGTYDGKTASLLSNIFPGSNITTVDLPDDDPILKNSYSRDSPEILEEYRKKQVNNTSASNISYHGLNSFFLPGLLKEKQFDLIWIDGGHLYPEVAWDICNAYHLCKKGGWIMCDDIIMERKGFKNNQVSPDSYCVLEYIKERTSEEITYFLKREDPVWSADPYKRKFVALMKKN